MTSPVLSLEEKLEVLPKSPGVYLFKDEKGKVIYIGKARVLRHRVRQYFQKTHDGRYQYSLLVSKIMDVEVIATDTELEALILENNLVRLQKPRFNIDLRDDKSFPFLRITKEEFPRIFLTRHPIQDGSRYFGPYSDLWYLKGLLRLLRQMLKIRTCNLPLTEVAIDQKKFKTCLEFQIGRCNAPCVANESKQTYGQHVQDFLDVLNGKGAHVVGRLYHEMERFAEDMKFEQAAQVRDWLSALDALTQKQKIISAAPISRDIIGIAVEDDSGSAVIFQVRGGRMTGKLDYRLRHVKERETGELLESLLQRYYSQAVSMPDEIVLPEDIPNRDVFCEWLKERAGGKIGIIVPERGEKAQLVDLAKRNAELLLGEQQIARQMRERTPISLSELQKHLRLEKPPFEIAAFDISTLQGSDKVASMVVFRGGRPAKSEYRRYRIQTVEGLDDFASMKEVIGRRFSRLIKEDRSFPDLVLIDGGKGQLASACDALATLGIMDQPIIGLAKRLEEVFVSGDSMPLNIPKTSSALKLLQQVRDEAHRFAIIYHRQLRKKRSLRSLLEEIEGVGPTRRSAILRHFGTLGNLELATLEEIEAVEGMQKPVAARVFHFFQERART